MSAKRNAFAAMATAAFVLCATSNVLHAQQTPPPDRPPAITADDRDRVDMDWGWIGLLGLAGLAGLMGRGRDERVRTTTTRT